MGKPFQSAVVVLISANIEWRATRRLFSDVDVKSSPFGEWFVATIGENARPVLFFHGGWGKIAAAASAQYVIDHCAPSLIVNLGTCGGFEGQVERGTLILVERTIVYDIHEQMGDHDEHIAHYSTEIDLDWFQSRYPHDVVRTLMVSGDRDLVAEEVPHLHRQFGAIVGDWESGSIAWVARRNNVKSLILRAVSDLVGTSGGEAYDGKISVFEHQVEIIMERLVRQLPDWIALPDGLQCRRSGPGSRGLNRTGVSGLSSLKTMTVDDVIETFEVLGDWESQCEYLIELGRELPEFPAAARTDEHRVHGCQSNVWLVSELRRNDPPTIEILADSDSLIVRGLIAVLLTAYSGRTPREILDTNIQEVFARLGLTRHLSSQRRNGLFGMVNRIRALAGQAA